MTGVQRHLGSRVERGTWLWIAYRGRQRSDSTPWIHGHRKESTLRREVRSGGEGDQFRFVQVAFEACLKHPNMEALPSTDRSLLFLPGG